MNKNILTIFLTFTLALWAVSDVKMVEVGWDCTDAAFVARNAQRMKQQRPMFDGVIFYLTCCSHPFRHNSLDETKYQNDLISCENIAGGPLTDNFIKMYTDGDASENLDWFDDSRWEEVLTNVTKMAAAGALAECKGILIDFETYSTCPWSYSQATHKSTMTFEQYEARVRACGSEFIQAIESKMPGVVLFSFWDLSYFTEYFNMDDDARHARLKASTGSNLLPAFLEGIMDGASSKMTFIDGNERSYYYTSQEQFQQGYDDIKTGSVKMISSGNKTKYQKKIRAAQAMYMDEIFDIRGKTWDRLSRFLTEDEQCQLLEYNTYWAMSKTDKYVWCYSEMNNWWITEEENNYPNGYRDGNGLAWWNRISLLNKDKAQAAILSGMQKFRNDQPLGFDNTELKEKSARRFAKVYLRNGTPVPDAIRTINLCQNGDFESGWTNWGQNTQTAPYATYNYNLSTTNPFHGSKCINMEVTKVDFDGRPGHARTYQGMFTLEQGVSYVLDFAYKTTDGADGAMLWTVPAVQNGTYSVTLPPTNGEWKRYVSRGVIASSDTGAMTVYLTVKDVPTQGKAWFDDVIVVPESEYDRIMNATYSNPPTITLSGDTTTPRPYVPLTITTNKACDLCYSTNDANWIDCDGTVNITKNGTYKVMAVDENGLTAFQSITFSNIQETSGQPILLTADTTTPTLKAKLTATTELPSTIYYNTVSADYAGKWTTYSKPIPVVENGTYYFKAVDAYGFETTSSITFTNIYVRPEITLMTNSTTPTKQTNLIARTNSGLAIYYSQKYTGPWKRYTAPISVTENGLYYFKTAKDSVGQIGQAFVQFKNIDNTPPFLLLTGNTTRKVSSATLLAQSEKNAVITYNTVSADYDGDWSTYTEVLTVTANATYFFRATDQAGNVTEKSITFANITWPQDYPLRALKKSVATPAATPQVETTPDPQATEEEPPAAPEPTVQSQEEPTVDNTTVTPLSNTPQILTGDTDDIPDVFVCKPKGIWGSGYQATHVGNLGEDWDGTQEAVSLRGKNKIVDIYTGSEDISILLLTDDANGDALFLDDIFSALPTELDEPLARIAGIDEIYAGDGDDIVDMTSKNFAYLGEGMVIHGGNGNDVIWANKGNNVLYGDAGKDRLVGASGDDILDGGLGDDSLHGGGGNDTVRLCENWGHDTVEQLPGGKITLLIPANVKGTWNPVNMTFTSEDGENTVTVIGITEQDVTITFEEE